MMWTSVLLSSQVTAQDKILIYNSKEHVYSGEQVNLRIDQKQITYNGMYPVIIEGRTLVPLREVMESPQIGATVTFVHKLQPILIQRGDMTIEITINSMTAKVNGVETPLDVPALLIRDKAIGIDKTMVPIRFITEALGYKVDWDQRNREVVLTSNQQDIFEFSTLTSNITSLRGVAIPHSLPTELYSTPIKFSVPTQEGFVELVERTDEASNGDTSIVEVVGNVSESRFYIRSQGSMSTIKYSYWDNKVIIDIDGLVMGNFPTVIRMDKGVYAEAVRTSQYSENPYKGRIVFDLHTNAIPREVNINPSRTEIEIVFNEVGLADATISQDTQSDYLLLKGDYSNYSLLRLENPNRLMIDLETTVNLLGKKEQNFIVGQEIKNVKIGQFTYDTTRIVIETLDVCDVIVDYDEMQNQTLIRFLPAKFSQVVFEKKTVNSIDSVVLTVPSLSYLPEMITQTTNYANFTTTLTFANLVPELSQTESMFVGDGNINTLSVKTIDGKSVITIEGNHLLEYTMEQQENGFAFVGRRPKDMYNTIVVVDLGHGGNDPGASYNGLIEKNVNLAIGQYFKGFIPLDSRIRYYFTREADTALSLQDRVDIANDLEADFMISLHNNAIDISKDPSKKDVKGLEILTTINESKSEKEIQVANGLYAYLQTNLPSVNFRGVRDYSKLFILRYTTMPAIIVEYGFLTNVQDSDNLKNEAILSEFARLTESYIRATFE